MDASNQKIAIFGDERGSFIADEKGKSAILKPDNPPRLFISGRLLMVLMCTVYVAVLESLNGTLSFAWVCMVENNRTGNITGDLDWDKTVQTRLFLADVVAMVVFLIPTGWAIDNWGANKFVLIGLSMASIATILIPPAAVTNYWIVVGLRAFLGVGYACVDPVVFNICSQWAPKKEMGLMYALGMSGFQIGPFAALLISGVECDTIGWPWVFYICGIAGLVVVGVWTVFYSDDPESSRWISTKECKYIMEGRDRKAKDHPHIPWRSIFTSLPVYAIFYNCICMVIVNIMLRRYTPTYISEVLQVSATQNGFFTSLTYVSQLVSRWIAGPVSDLESPRFTNTVVTKIFNTLSYGGTGLCLIGLSFVKTGTHVAIPVALLIGSMFFLTFYTAGFQKSTLYIAPELSGTIFSIGLFLSMIFALATQSFIGWMTVDKTDAQWRNVFYVMAAVSFSSALVFILFGSGELQPWAQSRVPDSEETIEKKKEPS